MLKIDPRTVGKIIGPKGSTIKELQQMYNVRISISKENDENGLRTAELQGLDDDIQIAMQAIRDQFLQTEFHTSNTDRRGRGSDLKHYTQRNNSRDRSYGNSTRYNNQDSYNNNYQQQNYQAKRPIVEDEWEDKTPNRSLNEYKSTSSKELEHDWGMEEMRSNFQPSLNAYTTSKSSNNNFDDSSSSKPKFTPNSSYDNRRRNDTYANNNNDNNYSTNRYNYNSRNDKADTQTPTESSNSYEPIDWDKVNAECDAARKARWEKCPLLKKDFYTEHPNTAGMTQEEIDKFHFENNNISVSLVFDETASKESMPKPVTRFEYAFENYPDLLAEVQKQGFDRPSPIQSQMWPILLRGEDCIGIAQTGTGKTLAFLLPALIHTDGQPHPRGTAARGGPNILVLAPTRELAIQIEKEVAKYQFRNIRAICLYGGSDRKKQIEMVESGVEMIVATPGRLNDLVAAKYIKIESITYLVLDEADRMLDMGFEPQIRKLLLDIRDDRQTVMTSATWPSGVRRLASSYMKNPYQVVIGTLDLAATHTVTQRIEIMDEDDKNSRIFRFALEEMGPNDKAIIFCGKKDRADSLSCDFVLKGINCQSIHGNRDQQDREQALADIKSGEVNILIATDVASRGIDIEDITYVVNYDFPRNIEEYVHRVGRTGRAGKKGTSISFLTRFDWGSAKELIEILSEAEQEIPQELHDMAERFQAKKARAQQERESFRGGSRGSFRGGNGGGGSFRGGSGSYHGGNRGSRY